MNSIRIMIGACIFCKLNVDEINLAVESSVNITMVCFARLNVLLVLNKVV